jgi:hypothetical protein
VRAVPIGGEGENIFAYRVKLGNVFGFEKLNMVLDSGATETMVTEEKFADKLTNITTKIMTASKNADGLGGVYGHLKSFLFSDGQTPVRFGENDLAIFSGGLSDNLASVGKICEGGFSILFSRHGYTIFKSTSQVRGKPVHTQSRDPRTGLYPLTLMSEKFYGQKQKQRDDLSDSGLRNSHDNIHRGASHPGDVVASAEDIRKFFSCIALWADAACHQERRAQLSNNKNTFLDIDKEKLSAGYLSNFY